jgi:hypothetical protein
MTGKEERPVKTSLTNSILKYDRVCNTRQCKGTYFVPITQTKLNQITLKTPQRVKSTSLPQPTKNSQRRRVYACFLSKPRTMLDVSIKTGILRANICRYVAEMRKLGIIQVHHIAKDVHTRMLCAYLTTDTALFNQPMYNQLNLFD